MSLMNPPCFRIRMPALPSPSLVRILRQSPRPVLLHRQECVSRGVQAPELASGAIESARTGHAGRRRQARTVPLKLNRPPA